MSDINTPSVKWNTFEKTAFRFFFILLGSTSIVGYNMIAEILNFSFEQQMKWFTILSKPVGWLDGHFFHIGFQPGKDLTYFGDGRFGYALLSILFSLSLLGTMVWGIADRKRINYNKLHYWFRLYLAYYLFLGMLIYAIEKIIPTQMAFPNAESLTTMLGDKSGFNIIWDFIGSRPAYSIFTGICEFAAALLILFPRTRVFGLLFMLTVLANVVCFNIFYNIPVKLLSSQLLVVTLFLLVPALPKLLQLFYQLKAVSLADKEYHFSTTWKRCLLTACLWSIPVWVTFNVVRKTLRFQADIAASNRQQQLYTINTFIKEKDTLAPLLMDTVRWKRLFFTNYRKDRYAIIYDMNDQKTFYEYSWDSLQKTITFKPEDTTKKYVFHYSALPKNGLAMEGKWDSMHIKILLDKFYTDSMPMVKEKTVWVQQH